MVGELSLDGWIVSDHPKNPLPEATGGKGRRSIMASCSDAGGCDDGGRSLVSGTHSPRYQISV